MGSRRISGAGTKRTESETGGCVKEIISTEKGPKALGPYSQAVKANGFIFTAGQGPLDPATGKLVQGDTAAQTVRVMENLKAIVEAAGSSLDRAVKANVYLKDMQDFAAMNEGLRALLSAESSGAHNDSGGAASAGYPGGNRSCRSRVTGRMERSGQEARWRPFGTVFVRPVEYLAILPMRYELAFHGCIHFPLKLVGDNR